MASNKIKQILKRDSVQTTLMIGIILLVVFALWFGCQAVLKTDYPALAVSSGSMCKVEDNCKGISHPFARTLHTGDLIILSGVNASDIHVGQEPEGDIIVFHKPQGSSTSEDVLIVHRAIEKIVHNGLIYFRSKGDHNPGSGDRWSDDYRGENYSYNGMVSEKLVVGKVIFRIPWLGHVALFMRNSIGVYVIIALVVLLIIVEFAIPIFRKKPINTEAQPESSNESSAT